MPCVYKREVVLYIGVCCTEMRSVYLERRGKAGMRKHETERETEEGDMKARS